MGTRNKWQYMIGIGFIILMTISFVNIVGNNPGNTSLQQISIEKSSFPLNIDVSYGTRLLHTNRGILQGEVVSNSLITVIPTSQYNSKILTGISFEIKHITEFALMALGSLTIHLYKSLQSKEQKEWAKNRLLIRDEIHFNPGISLRELSRTTGLAIGSTQYWLRILEQNNEIDIFAFGRSKHYFLREQQLSIEEKLLFALKQNKRILEILQSLHKNPEIQTQKDLCDRLGYNKSLLSYYVKILKNHRVINSEVKNLSISEDFQSLLN